MNEEEKKIKMVQTPSESKLDEYLLDADAKEGMRAMILVGTGSQEMAQAWMLYYIARELGKINKRAEAKP